MFYLTLVCAKAALRLTMESPLVLFFLFLCHCEFLQREGQREKDDTGKETGLELKMIVGIEGKEWDRVGDSHGRKVVVVNPAG